MLSLQSGLCPTVHHETIMDLCIANWSVTFYLLLNYFARHAIFALLPFASRTGRITLIRPESWFYNIDALCIFFNSAG